MIESTIATIVTNNLNISAATVTSIMSDPYVYGSDRQLLISPGLEN